MRIRFGGVLFAISAAAVWEFFEFIMKQVFNSYVIFGDSLDGGAETFCNAVFLDIGNGILGAFLAYATNQGKLNPNIKYSIHWVIFVVVGLLYSFLSGFSWYCAWDPNCAGEMVSFHWGSVVNIVLLSIWLYFCFADTFWIWVNVFIISILGTIPVLSSAIMVYIGSAICFLIQWLRKRKYNYNTLG